MDRLETWSLAGQSLDDGITVVAVLRKCLICSPRAAIVERSGLFEGDMYVN